MDYSGIITVEPGKRSGQPCIRGMRITVRDVLEYLAGGMSVDEVLADFPELTLDDVPRLLGIRGEPNAPEARRVSLLFDENLSWRLPARLGEYPGCRHVVSSGYADADDRVVWAYAAAEGLAVVSKDRDFVEMARAQGPPPKVVWLRVGNGPTREIETLLRSRLSEVVAFLADPSAGLLELG